MNQICKSHGFLIENFHEMMQRCYFPWFSIQQEDAIAKKHLLLIRKFAIKIMVFLKKMIPHQLHNLHFQSIN